MKDLSDCFVLFENLFVVVISSERIYIFVKEKKLDYNLVRYCERAADQFALAIAT